MSSAPGSHEPSQGENRDGAIIRGTGLRPLPDETIERALRRGVLYSNIQAEGLDLYLTNRRMILHGQDRIFLVIPSGRKVRSAYLEDIDSGGLRTKRLPQWMLITGLTMLLLGLAFLLTGDDSSDYNSRSYAQSDFGAPSMLVGAVLAGLWLLIKREQLVFSVAGTDLFEWDVFRGAGGGDRAGDFLSQYYELRPEYKTPRA